MPTNIKTIKTILGIDKRVDLTPPEMAKNLKITFFPHKENIDEKILKFGEKLENTLSRL